MAIWQRRLSYPERLVLAHERRGTLLLVAGAVAGVIAATLLSVADDSSAMVVGVVAAVLLMRGRRHFALARRAEVGVYSERESMQALSELERRGWEVRANVPFPGRGDIDHVVSAPGGPNFAIETKTKAYDRRHLDRTRDAAQVVARRAAAGVPTIAILTTSAKRRTTVERAVIVCWTRNLVAVIDRQHADYHARP